ncbi:hypothetical protein AM501_12820 [Aneurinibacillus migulanus]|uniref:hypothetical protein n=1 Tax=Aneurinibacillus migulanus TaxID=47500 RepID=UPI0005B9C2CE|nr:hypothetical protein [Aneurinibacillus migulanus]KIV56111.1 hypothetical protein TS64_11625 [Aneurinibacillus migulanus]KPD07943.1 hypothetical protein AM501_12820 [Aneurinibacillus migulanus]CEH29423.1 Phage XkdN-like protein [Aneurinibacillus migulanus]
MSDKLQKYLEKAKGGRRDDIIKVKADGDEWSVRRLTTMEVRRSIELAVNEDGSSKDTYNEIDVMIVKATEHEFDWNTAELLKAYNCIEKFELPPRVLDNPDDYAALSRAVRNFTDTKEALIKEGKNSSAATEKQAG